MGGGGGGKEVDMGDLGGASWNRGAHFNYCETQGNILYGYGIKQSSRIPDSLSNVIFYLKIMRKYCN